MLLGVGSFVYCHLTYGSAQKDIFITSCWSFVNKILSCRNWIYSQKSAAADLTPEDVNRYYRLNRDLLPEAFQEFYEGILVDKGGCKALQVTPKF